MYRIVIKYNHRIGGEVTTTFFVQKRWMLLWLFPTWWHHNDRLLSSVEDAKKYIDWQINYTAREYINYP